MKVYKYRAASEFKRDLKAISDNYFYAPNSEKLNDPCETLVFSDNFKKESLALVKVFGEKPNDSLKKLHEVVDNFLARREKIGIYSLSKRFDDELMWAHYANNHSGFCIEYDYDILLNGNSFSNFYTFSVEYKKSPPQVDILDMIGENQNKILKKLAGTKSKRWSYEEELRIITDKFGKHHYDFKAVKSIYFGYRMNDNEKNEIMKSLSGRDIKYFQISLNEKSYSFYPIEISDKYENAQKYLFNYYREYSVVKYKILEQNYLSQFNKGELSISLEHKLTEKELKNLGLQLRNKLFKSAEVVYVFYYLAETDIQNRAWAITHFEKDKKTISIQGLTIDEENQFLEQIEKDNRDIIGHWIDEAYLNSLMTLYKKDNKVYLDTLCINEKSSIKEQKTSILDDGVRYEDIPNKHGDYFIIDLDGVLYYYSVDGLFNTIKKQPITMPSKT